MWDVKWFGAQVGIFEKAAELRLINLVERLITSHNPFCQISLESFVIKCLCLAI
jgi:hypothetical protein